MNNTKPKAKKTSKQTNLIPFPICFFGHRRRKLARFVIECLKKNLKMTGYKPVFIFGNCGKDEDYRTQVIDAIKENFGEKAFHCVFDCPGVEGLHNGLNQAMNRCIEEAFKIFPMTLRLEDDWVLQKELDIGPWINLCLQDNVAGVRLGQIGISPEQVKPYRPDLGLDWLDYKPQARYPINHQVFLIHKRVYDLVGNYNEQMNIDEAEFSFGRRFRVKCKKFEDPNYPKVLWPHGQPLDIDPHQERFFQHGGYSSPALKHDYFYLAIPEYLIPYQEPDDQARIDEIKKRMKEDEPQGKNP